MTHAKCMFAAILSTEKMRKLITLSFIVAMLTGCSNHETKSTSDLAESPVPQKVNSTMETTKLKRIVFFGNSLTAAYGLDKDQGFPALIQQKIDSLTLQYTCINAGVSGETTSGGVERVDWILKNPVSIFVLELGANDGLRGIQTEETKKNLMLILNKVQAKYPKAKLVLAGMYVPPNMGPEYAQKFRSIYPEVAAEYNAALIPFLLDNVATVDTLLLDDKLHPNAKGQRIVAQNVWSYIYPLLEK